MQRGVRIMAIISQPPKQVIRENQWQDDLSIGVEDMEFDRKYTIPIQRLPRLTLEYAVPDKELVWYKSTGRFSVAICDFWLDTLIPLFAKLYKRKCSEQLLLKRFTKEELGRIHHMGYIEYLNTGKKKIYGITLAGIDRYEELKKDAKSIRDFRSRARTIQAKAGNTADKRRTG
jgi:predicted YcjX-like family ATPase